MSRFDRSLERYRPRDDHPVPYGTGPSHYTARPYEHGPSSEDEWLEVRQLVLILLKGKWTILLIACLVVIPVAIATALAERLYLSSAMVQIDPEPVQVLPYREIDLPSLTPNYEMFMKSQEQILRGSALVSRIASRLESGPDAGRLKSEVPHLWGRLSIQRVENTQIFRLNYAAPDPQVAADVANAFAEEYIKLHFETRQETREKARELLKRELDTLEERVQLSEKELVKYQQEHGITTKEPDQGTVPQKLTLLSAQVTEAERDVFVAKSQLESLQQASETDFPERLVTPAISGLVSRLLQLEHDLTALRATFGENWPAVVQKRAEIALARDQLQRERVAALKQAREQAALDLAAAENKRNMIAASMNEQEQLVHQLESASIQYNIIRREVDTNQKMYEALLERLNQTSVTAGMAFGGFHVIEKASPTTEVYSPRTVWDLSLASVLGLALGVCFVVGRHYWDTSISTIEEVEHLTVLPVLGTMPEVRAPLQSRGLLSRTRARLNGRQGQSIGMLLMSDTAGTYAASSLGITPAGVAPSEAPTAPLRVYLASDPVAAEGVRNVCASILLSQSGRPPRVLMVTSTVPGEGKTTLVHELGRAFAENGKRTLLIECDLRRPAFGSLFGIGAEGGLSLFLSGLVGPTPTIHPTATSDHLFVVGAGPTAPNPPTLLGSDKMRQFVRDMMSSYEFIIMDTPPVLPMADARVLSRIAEGVVLVVRAGRVSKPLLRRVCAVLEDARAQVLGAVLNGVDPHGSEASYYQYYQQYYQN